MAEKSREEGIIPDYIPTDHIRAAGGLVTFDRRGKE
jgi:hypothetical protein